MEHIYYVYILANKRNGTLYTGVTNDLPRRMDEHKTGIQPGFAKTYDVKLLVYYESYQDIEFAIRREKRLKKWDRKWKSELIETNNPNWQDLYLNLNN